MTTWTRIDFGNNVSCHAVSAELRAHLLADMAARNHVPTATYPSDPGWQIEKSITAWHLDLGGSVITDAPTVEVTIDGLEVSCWADQIQAVIMCCQRAATRTFADGTPYHKIHTWPGCSLVVTPAQHAEIIASLTAAVPDAIDRASAFEVLFLERLRRLRVLQTGGDVDVEN